MTRGPPGPHSWPARGTSAPASLCWETRPGHGALRPLWDLGSPKGKGENSRGREKEIGNQGSGSQRPALLRRGWDRTRRTNWLRCSRCLPGFGPSPAGSGQSLSAGPGVQHSPARGSRRVRPWRVPDGSPRDPEGCQEGIRVNSLEFALFPSPFSPPPALLGHFRFRVSPAAPQPRSGTAAMAPALRLGLLWGLLGLLGNPGGATKVLHSLRYLHVAVSEPSPGIPQYMEIGYLDGIPFVRYDSEWGRMEPLTQWIKDGVELGYWERETQRAVRNQHIDAGNLETLRERYNQSRGLHTRLRLYGCDLLSDGSVRGSSRNGYDGRDFISFDLGFRKFVAADSAAEITRRRWEQEEEAERWINYLKHECPEWLKKYVGYGQKELEHKEPPDVHVSGREEHRTLILSCHAYGFYPNTIAVSWMKGGETLDQETEWGGIVPNSDGTFHTWARIEVLLEEREQYRCRVEHPGMPEPGIFAWEPTSGGNLTVVVAVSIIAAILILTVLIGFSIWRLQSGRRDRNGYNPAAGKDVGTNGLTTGITA